MTDKSISFKEMFFGYIKLLRDNPGMGLKLDGNDIAVLVGDELCYVTLNEDGSDFSDMGCADPRGWEDSEDAAKIIANPVFVSVSHLDLNRDA